MAKVEAKYVSHVSNIAHVDVDGNGAGSYIGSKSNHTPLHFLDAFPVSLSSRGPPI
jgi:hypothetical protein